MSGYAVLDSGNYDLQIATGFIVDGFTLDMQPKAFLTTPILCWTEPPNLLQF
jgi:hypothetical protein